MSDFQETDFKNLIFKDEESLLLDHDYDGIQELDHPLPFWWLAILYGTSIFAVLYGIYFHGMDGHLIADEFKSTMIEIRAKQPKQEPTGAVDEAALLAAIKDPAKIELGKAVFVKNCAACHGESAQGLIGPNLTDNNWIHGQGLPSDIVSTITTGVAEKGMPPWGPVLKAEEILGAAAYIRSLHGSNPANPKEPQGPEYEFKEI
jgi:cytochrome c oxidase cbb3-type subunit 3